MLFTSYQFAVFLAFLLLLYYLFPKKYRWGVLLAGSLGFYSLTGAANCLLILLTWGSSYVTALLMARSAGRGRAYLAAHKAEMEKSERKAYKAREKKKRFLMLSAALFFNFALLAVLKLNLFSLGSLAGRINTLWHLSKDFELLSLLGLSFYTFQTMGYLIEVYREKAPAEKNPLRLGLFVTFFPLLVQGPICRYGELYEELFKPHTPSAENFREGLLRIFWGLFKIYLAAARVGNAVTLLAGDPKLYKGPFFLLLTVLYSLQIYANFTGGIDMTVGIARLFGIGLPENFRQPFFSKSTKEYWNRWHISLGNWFTDYLFYPLSVCRPVLFLTGKAREHLGNGFARRFPVYFATILTWAVTGLWHGTAWNFLVWGLLNCLVILVSQELSPLYKKFRRRFPRLTESPFYAGFEMLRTFLLMGFIRILDVYGDVPVTFRQYFTWLLPSAWKGLPSLSAVFAGASLVTSDLVILGFAVAAMLAVSVLSYRKPMTERLRGRPCLSLVLLLTLLTVTLLFGRYGYGYDASAFRYA